MFGYHWANIPSYSAYEIQLSLYEAPTAYSDATATILSRYAVKGKNGRIPFNEITLNVFEGRKRMGRPNNSQEQETETSRPL